MTKTELPRWLHFGQWHLIFVSPQYVTHFTPPYRHLIYWGGHQIFWKFIIPWTKSSCTLHTNLYCITNDTKIWNTTAYTHGHTTFWPRQNENTSVNGKTNNPNQLWEQQNTKHNHYCTAHYNVMKLSTWRLKCYTTVAFHFLKINHIIPVKPERSGMGKGQCIHAITGTGELRDMAILFLAIGIGWGREVVTPHTANLPRGKRPGMHCRRD